MIEVNSAKPFCFYRKAANGIADPVVIVVSRCFQVDPEDEIEAPFLQSLALLFGGGKLQQALSLPIQPIANHLHESFHVRHRIAPALQ
ncbi:hypothetical protein NA66_10134 [Burkholderia pyrrocinia]|uniref:Uncharacterized protein n=1 Tax=Burkholderia pyrrocinia TaxID=60550 RepID=A0A318ILW2_BURPY|nr:hypothetical protein NA66_10134 [Burkholderia pyrrocinia]SFW88073.1 hypothetical protein SAMN03159384_06561 [Burkholderia sp. NFACC33-1]SFY40102.1 hypothetical protein SAMN03159408_04837 [Burkholderia sp. NFPP32]